MTPSGQQVKHKSVWPLAQFDPAERFARRSVVAAVSFDGHQKPGRLDEAGFLIFDHDQIEMKKPI